MTDPKIPTTEAGRALVNKYRTMNDGDLSGYVLAIEAEARADLEHRVELLTADINAERQHVATARADALRGAADAIEAEIAVIYDRTLTAETVEAAKALHEVLDRGRALHAILAEQKP